MMSITVADLFRSLWEDEHRLTVAMLEAIPDDRMDYVPWPGAMEMRRLALHVIGLEAQFIRGVLSGEVFAGESRRDQPEVRTAAGLVAFCKEQHEALRPVAAQVDSDLMERPVSFKLPHGPLIFVAAGREFLFTKLLHHLIHHRGQLLAYLRMCGAPVPGLYGPNREETPPLP